MNCVRVEAEFRDTAFRHCRNPINMPSLCAAPVQCDAHTVQVVSNAELNEKIRSLEYGFMLPFSSKDVAERSGD